MLCLSAFSVSAAAAYYDFGATGEEAKPEIQTYALVNDNSLHYDFWPVYFGWLQSDGSWKIRLDNTNFGFGEPIYPKNPDYTVYPNEKPRRADVGFGAGWDVAIDAKNYTELIDLGENTTNTITVNFDTTIDYLVLQRVRITLYCKDNAVPMTKEIVFYPNTTLTPDDEAFCIDFNTSGNYSRFGYVEFRFERSGASLGPERYLVIKDIKIQDSESIEEESFFSGLIDSVIKAITSIPDKIKGFFTSLGDAIGGFITSAVDSIKGFFADLLEGIKKLFVPEDNFFSDTLSKLQEEAKKHLGLLYEIPEFVINIIQSLIDHIAKAGNNRVIEYPALRYDNYTILEAGSINFQYYIDILEKHNLYTIYKTFVSVIGAIWFINFAYNKLQVILGSDSA